MLYQKMIIPRSHRATTLVRSCRSCHDLKKYWIGTNRDRSVSKSRNLANNGLHYHRITILPRPARC
jgi:hypothetical protein